MVLFVFMNVGNNPPEIYKDQIEGHMLAEGHDARRTESSYYEIIRWQSGLGMGQFNQFLGDLRREIRSNIESDTLGSIGERAVGLSRLADLQAALSK